MPGGRLFKKLLLAAFVIFIYILLTSTIIDQRSEKKLAEAIVESALRISEARFGHQASITEMEREKTAAELNPGLAAKLSGRFLLQTEVRGQLWYVNPADSKRYYLARENEAFRFIQRVMAATSTEQMIEYEYFSSYPSYLAGRFVQAGADTCYIDPTTLRSDCFLAVDAAYELIKAKALGISNQDLRSLAVGDPFAPSK